jgi:acetolactate synthase-1/2/3 large subunit
MLAETLRAAGVEVVFGLPGVHNLALWPALDAAGITIIGSRHEQGCAYAADGYARATGRVGVALVTTGPGAANTLGAVGEAWASKSPVVVLATDIPSTQRRAGVYRGVLHETTDQSALFAPVTKLRTHDLAAALAAAATPPHGPAYVEVPTDALTRPMSAPPPAPAPRRAPAAFAGDPTLDAQRPLLWVGGGAKDAGAAVDALARTLGAPVITTYSARGVLPAGHPHLVPAPPHEPQVTALVRDADCTIAIGSDLDAMNTMAWRLPLPSPRIAINVDTADAAKNYPFDRVIEADASAAAGWAAMLEPRAPWFPDLAALGKDVRDELRADEATRQSIEFLERTETALHAHGDPVVFADMCIPGYWLAGHAAVHTARGLHYPMGWGTLGWAFPASIGAAAAGRRSVAFMGDGGMLFALGELAAVAQHRLPLTVVVVDDGGYGMLRYPAPTGPGCELSPVDFVAVARGCGVDAVAVSGTGAEYEAALAGAIDGREPRLLHVAARLFPPRTTSPRWPMRESPRDRRET